MKYRHNNLHGLVLVDKPTGISSMDAVRAVRRAAGHCKTGHAGTLDPFASGLLICCLGRATKAVNSLMDHAKCYEATVNLRAFSETDDREGALEQVEVPTAPTRAEVEEVLSQLTGEFQQVPPAHSAVKIGGRRAYEMARAGEDVHLPTRTVFVERVEVRRYAWPTLEITLRCSKGTYVRSIARDIGRALGTGGYLEALRRTAIGPYDVSDAYTLDRLPRPLGDEHLRPIPERQGAARTP